MGVNLNTRKKVIGYLADKMSFIYYEKRQNLWTECVACSCTI